MFDRACGLLVRVVRIATSIGMTASVPYTRRKGVSLVSVCKLVQYAHNTFCNSSTQFPLAFPRLFLIPLTKVRFINST